MSGGDWSSGGTAYPQARDGSPEERNSCLFLRRASQMMTCRETRDQPLHGGIRVQCSGLRPAAIRRGTGEGGNGSQGRERGERGREGRGKEEESNKQSVTLPCLLSQPGSRRIGEQVRESFALKRQVFELACKLIVESRPTISNHANATEANFQAFQGSGQRLGG